jgi:hypothetical protein
MFTFHAKNYAGSKIVAIHLSADTKAGRECLRYCDLTAARIESSDSCNDGIRSALACKVTSVYITKVYNNL